MGKRVTTHLVELARLLVAAHFGRESQGACIKCALPAAAHASTCSHCPEHKGSNPTAIAPKELPEGRFKASLNKVRELCKDQTAANVLAHPAWEASTCLVAAKRALSLAPGNEGKFLALVAQCSGVDAPAAPHGQGASSFLKSHFFPPACAEKKRKDEGIACFLALCNKIKSTERSLERKCDANNKLAFSIQPPLNEEAALSPHRVSQCTDQGGMDALPPGNPGCRRCCGACCW